MTMARGKNKIKIRNVSTLFLFLPLYTEQIIIFSFCDFHTSFLDLWRSAYVAYIYLLQVEKAFSLASLAVLNSYKKNTNLSHL